MYLQILYTVCCLLAVVSLAIIGFLLYIFFKRRRYANIPGAPVTSFFLGHAAELREIEKKGVYRYKLILEWAKLYGPVFKLFFIHKCMVMVVSPTGIKELLTKSKYPKSSMVYNRIQKTCGERFFGRGLVTNTDYNEWKQRRGFVNPAFHKKYLNTFMKQFNEVGDEWIVKITELADGKTTFSMAEMMARFTLDTVGKVAFHMDVGAIEDSRNLFPQKFSQVLEGLSKATKNPFFMLDIRNKPFIKEVQESAKYIRNRCEKVMLKRIDDVNRGHQVPNDALTFMLESMKEMPHLTVEDIVDDFTTMFLAGSETTANVLSFLLGEVGRNPHVLHKLKKEVSSVLGDSDCVTYEHVGKLEYMNQVWCETLRLYPPAPATVRDVPETTVIDGCTIPAGSTVIFPFYVIHRLPQHFSDPLEFNPDRFDADKERPMFTYLPFSLGQRSCLGKQFAQVEGKVLLCKFFQHFNYKLEPDQSFEVSEATTLRPKGGTMMTLTCKH